MIPILDSAIDRPTPAIVQQALAAGVKGWGGYLATRAGVNLLSPWDLASFEVAKAFPAMPLAFCSGLDDPVACARQAAAWGVRLCLDVESGIRGDGSWVQPWLDASGAGLYGVASVHNGRSATFHVLARYPGFDPGATWSGAPPAGPHGWQWEGDHTEFGLSVDRGWYDDWFIASDPLQEDDMPKLYQGTLDGASGGNGHVWLSDLIWKRLVPTPGELAVVQQNLPDTTIHILEQEVLDNVRDVAAVQGPAGPAGPNTDEALRAALKSAVDPLT